MMVLDAQGPTLTSAPELPGRSTLGPTQGLLLFLAKTVSNFCSLLLLPQDKNSLLSFLIINEIYLQDSLLPDHALYLHLRVILPH